MGIDLLEFFIVFIVSPVALIDIAILVGLAVVCVIGIVRYCPATWVQRFPLTVTVFGSIVSTSVFAAALLTQLMMPLFVDWLFWGVSMFIDRLPITYKILTVCINALPVFFLMIMLSFFYIQKRCQEMAVCCHIPSPNVGLFFTALFIIGGIIQAGAIINGWGSGVILPLMQTLLICTISGIILFVRWRRQAIRQEIASIRGDVSAKVKRARSDRSLALTIALLFLGTPVIFGWYTFAMMQFARVGTAPGMTQQFFLSRCVGDNAFSSRIMDISIGVCFEDYIFNQLTDIMMSIPEAQQSDAINGIEQVCSEIPDAPIHRDIAKLYMVPQSLTMRQLCVALFNAPYYDPLTGELESERQFSIEQTQQICAVLYPTNRKKQNTCVSTVATLPRIR